jgi:hypothetical protein
MGAAIDPDFHGFYAAGLAAVLEVFKEQESKKKNNNKKQK